VISEARLFIKQHLNSKAVRNWLFISLIYAFLANILRDSIQGVENSLLVLVIITGLIVGWLLSLSSLRVWSAALSSLLIGALLLIVRIGRLGILLRSLFHQILLLFGEIWQWSTEADRSLNTQEIPLLLSDLQTRVITLGSRLITWFTNIFQGSPLYDPVAIAIIWGFLIWLISIWTMWLIFRHQKPLLGVAPALILASTSLVYTDKSAYHLIPILGLLIGLVILIQHDLREQSWVKGNLEIATSIRFKMLRVTLLLAAVLMSVAAVSPSVSIQNITDAINRLTKDRIDDDDLARSLGLEPPRVTANVNVLDNQKWGGLPNQHLIGSNPKLSDQVVMVIQLEELNFADSESEETGDQVYYWRSLTYDRYVGRGWVSRNSIEVTVPPGENTLSSWPDSYQILRQKVDFLEDHQSLLFSAGIPLSADQEFQVAWRLKGTEQGDFDLFGASIQANTYWVDSLQPMGGKAELRQAGQEYPGWIRERYIPLPESVPERVIALARDLTVNEPTPYDRAVAIENYLRKIPYSLELPPTPNDQDLADYFLFSIQKGYCDYYATTMVVLARAAGIPARLVTGYIGGYYDQDLDAYLVTADLAHSWVEVYFPDYGWIIFEPTGGRPAIDRPAESTPKFTWDYPASYDPFSPEKERTPINWATLTLLIILVLAFLGGVGFLLADFILARIPLKNQIPVIYKRIYRIARWMGVHPQPGDTANDFIQELIHLLGEYSSGSKRAAWLLEAENLLKEITWIYYLVLFHPDHGQGIQIKEIALTYRKLRLKLWYLWLLVRIYPNQILRFFLWDDEPLIIHPYLKPTQ
jgi:transglutaminase-like putative cysteine protease